MGDVETKERRMVARRRLELKLENTSSPFFRKVHAFANGDVLEIEDMS